MSDEPENAAEMMASAEPERRGPPEFQLVLNDDKPTLDSATIPLRWLFPKEVLDRKPTELLIVVQHETECCNIGEAEEYGERFRVPVSHGMMYLPFSRAGRHRITVFALAHDRSDQAAYKQRLNFRILKTGPRRYDWPISFEATGSLESWVVGRARTQVEIPAGFFAKKPKGILGELLWNWVNWGHEWTAPDQCAYRRRLLIALTLKPFGWLALRTVQVLLGAVFGLILMVMGLVGFCLGFRPSGIFQMTLRALCWEVPPNHKMEDHFETEWRVWSEAGGVEKTFTPPIVYLAITAVIHVAYLWFQAGLPWGSLVFAIGAFGLAMWPAYMAAKAFAECKASEYGDYLTREFSAERRAELLARQPKTGLVRKLVMSYEALKARVCKPFER